MGRSTLALALVLGCGGRAHAPSGPDGGVDRDSGGTPPGCLDRDFDGYGVGEECAGPDCDDGDPALWAEADCLARCPEWVGLAPGCPCEGLDTRTCYLGPPETLGAGQCRAGLMTCDGGVWGACEGMGVPGEESCDFVDNDCDGEIDEGVRNACDTCGSCDLACVGDGVGCDPWDPAAEGNGVVTCDAGRCITLYGAADGTYRHVFAGCDWGTEWRAIRFDADLPEGSSITWRARAANRVEDLETVPFVLVGMTPDDSSPFPIDSIYDDAFYGTSVLEVEARLVAGGSGAPVVWSFGIEYGCVAVGL